MTIKPIDPHFAGGTYFKVSGNHVIAANVDLDDLISLAYGIHIRQIVNGPAWHTSDHFDIDGVVNQPEKPNLDQMKLLFQGLLADRFRLAFHYDTRALPVYALVLGKNGPKFHKTDRKPTDPTNFSYTNSVVLTVRNASMEDFAQGMAATFMDRPVVDRTELKDRYDFLLQWTPEASSASTDATAPPDLYTAISEQLGLKLIRSTGAARVLIVDRVDKPSPN